MTADTSYRQHRCRHGWVDEGQCEDCATANRLSRLVAAINEMMAVLGYHGEISARDDRVHAVMDLLHEIDPK